MISSYVDILKNKYFLSFIDKYGTERLPFPKKRQSNEALVLLKTSYLRGDYSILTLSHLNNVFPNH